MKMNPLLKSLRTFLLVLVGLVVFAYGFQVTQVNFDEIASERRQQSLTRVIRALFRPDILEYDQASTAVNTPIYVPCRAGAAAPETGVDGAYLSVTPSCAEPRATVQVEGFDFPPNYRGQLYFIPPSGVSLGLTQFETDENGHFSVDARIPPRPNEEPQFIRTVTTENIGAPRLSRSATDTWNKIIETLFLALLATVFGIIFAIPISFFAARNLMRDITTPMSSLALSIVGWPVGIWLGSTVARLIGSQAGIITSNPLFALIGLLVCAAAVFFLARWALPQEDEARPSLTVRLARVVMMIVMALLTILALYLLASLMSSLGTNLERESGFLGMMGMFTNNLGEILRLLTAVFAAITGGAVVSGFLGRIGQNYIRPLPAGPRLVVNFILGAIAGAIIGYLIAAGLYWIYQFRNGDAVHLTFSLIGAALGILTVALTRKKDALPIGLVIYNITRTILNGLRAIEALIWVIIFVIWVGTGPFAGALALALHTIASLAKLYSEQVESISPGPLEAIRATGATRLQLIIYSVIPQIIPPYISFTMYRWDINVRMSTILGFGGGGGIGFLLIQNINLLNYRAASTQMLAIAIVVAIMDYLSSEIRERVV